MGGVKTLLGRSHCTYKAYLDSGKIFLYAKILKDCNERLRELLIANAHLLRDDHWSDALALIHHIDVWTARWEESFKSTSPNSDSVFTFENWVNFPHKEASRLIALSTELNRSGSHL